ncbi:MAG: NAD+ synthase [Chlamydiia bacterium]|jgi:NAD+ synthase (glutamine-hydrolysing)
MKIEMYQMNPVIGNLKYNTQKHLDAIERAKKDHIELLVFPELSICGYAPEDLLLHPSFLDAMSVCLDQIVKASKGIAVTVGLARRSSRYGEKGLLNSAAIICDGRLLGFQDKWLLPHYDVFSERRYFSPGHDMHVWEIFGKRVGVIICEDMWQNASDIIKSTYPRDPVRELVDYRPEVLVNLTASPYQYMKIDTRLKVCQRAAETLKCPVVYCCQVGANSELIFDGYSMYVSKDQKLLKLGKGFVEDRIFIDTEVAERPLNLTFDPMHDLYEALKLGIKDYFHKTGFKKALVSLSGGVDSALVAVLAAEALGKENVTGYFLPSKKTHSSQKKGVEKLVKNLGIQYFELEIDPIVDVYKKAMENTMHEMKPKTLESLKSRVRGALLMAFSNQSEALLLNNLNKSEMALGFCTLYGDMCGALGVIADVKKSQVYELCEWINRRYECIPRETIDRTPTHEERYHPKHGEEGIDYLVVDKVLTGYIEESKTVEQITKDTHIEKSIVEALVKKIYMAESKRRQSAPPLRVSVKSFGIGRRKPLTLSTKQIDEIY